LLHAHQLNLNVLLGLVVHLYEKPRAPTAQPSETDVLSRPKQVSEPLRQFAELL